MDALTPWYAFEDDSNTPSLGSRLIGAALTTSVIYCLYTYSPETDEMAATMQVAHKGILEMLVRSHPGGSRCNVYKSEHPCTRGFRDPMYHQTNPATSRSRGFRDGLNRETLKPIPDCSIANQVGSFWVP
jgi:hypothetical protein